MKKPLLAFIVAAMAVIPAHAGYIFGFTAGVSGTLTITTTDGVFINDAFDTGWYSGTGDHNSANKNYVIDNPSIPCPGGCAGADPYDVNDYFAFRLGQGAITGNILSATFSAFNPAGGYAGPAEGILASLWDVTTDVTTLMQSQSGQIGIFTDLGSGTLFASRTVTTADNGTNVVFNLNAAGLAAIAAASGPQGSSLFAIGGSAGPVSAVPEPSTWTAVSIGLLGLAARRRRR